MFIDIPSWHKNIAHVYIHKVQKFIVKLEHSIDVLGLKNKHSRFHLAMSQSDLLKNQTFL